MKICITERKCLFCVIEIVNMKNLMPINLNYVIVRRKVKYDCHTCSASHEKEGFTKNNSHDIFQNLYLILILVLVLPFDKRRKVELGTAIYSDHLMLQQIRMSVQT